MTLKASYETQKDDGLFNVIYRGVFALSANHPENLMNITISSFDDQLELNVCAQSQYFHRGKISELFLKVEKVGLVGFSPEFVKESIMQHGGKALNTLEFKGDFDFRYCAPDGGWHNATSSWTDKDSLKKAELLDVLGVPYRIENGNVVVKNIHQNISPLENQARAYLWGSDQGLGVKLVSCSGTQGKDLEIAEKYDQDTGAKKLTWRLTRRTAMAWWGLLGGLNKNYLDNLDLLLDKFSIKFGGRTWEVADSNALQPNGCATFVISPNF